MPIVRIARHGETDWNREGRYQGRLDTALSDLGREQASALTGALADKGIVAVISSPLSRCLDTATPLVERNTLQLQTDERLIEIAHGIWEGRLREEIRENDPQRLLAWKNDPAHVEFPGGENLADVRNRWRDFAKQFAPGHDTLIVTHDVVARIALLEATGREIDDLWKVRVLNAAYAEYEVREGVWRLIYECCDSHLANLRVDISAQAL